MNDHAAGVKGLMDRYRHIPNDYRIGCAIVAIVSFIVLLVTGDREYWGDLDHYYVNAGDVLSGLMPYSDTMFEYPPLSLVFMIIPRLLSWDLESFHYSCAILSYVFLAIGIYCLYKISDKYIGDRWRAHALMIMLVSFGTYFVIARNDVFPAVISIVGIWMYLEKRYTLAFIIIAIASMIKLYPGIFLLPMLVPLVLNRDWKTVSKCFISVAAVGILVELPFLIADPGTAFAYLTYHSDRGIQVESVASGFFMMSTYLFPSDISVVFNYGSDNLTGVGPDALAPYMNALMAGALVAFILIMSVRITRAEKAKENLIPIAGLMCVAMLMLFITFSKVYSAQYYIWVMLALPFTQLACFGKIHRREILAITLLFSIFTLLSYSTFAKFLVVDFNPCPVTMIFMKNIMHILLTLEILHMCIYETCNDKNVPERGFLIKSNII